MLDGIMALFRGRRVLPATSENFSVILPPDDPVDMDFGDDEEPDLESIAGVGCVLTYQDSRGAASMRRVTCRRLTDNAGTHYLKAFCHERSALRTFRLDRISDVACGATGEIYRPSAIFFSRFILEQDTGSTVGFGLSVQAAADLRACLNVLTFIARVDGRFIGSERETLQGFCQSYAVRYASDKFNLDGAMRYAVDLAPDAETFYVALERLTRERAPDGLRELVARFAVRMMDADGIQDDREFRYVNAVRDYLLG